MARLPEAASLGYRDPNSVRGIPTYATKDPGAEALEVIGQGLTKAATVGARLIEQDQRETNTAELARATSGLASDSIDLRDRFKNDQNYQTLPGRFGGDYEAARQARASSISDPDVRQKFLDGTVDEAARNNVWARDQASSLEKSYGTASFIDRATKQQDAYARSGDDEERKRLSIGIAAEAQTYVSKGWWTPQQANDFLKSWNEGADLTRLKAMPVGEQIATLGGSSGALRQRESSGNPRIQNSLGYTGLYQYGAPRLQTIGVYAPGENENLKSWSKTSRDAPGKWSGTLSIPGFPEVKTIDDFRANPEAQEAVHRLDLQHMDREIADQGLEKYVGQTVGGVTMTRDAIKRMIHLGGAKGAADLLNSGGKINARDENGASVLEYARLGGGQIANIPEGKRLDLLQRAENAQQQDHRQAQAARAQIAAEQAETIERGIIDASIGQRPLMSRVSIESDPTLDDPRRNTLLRQYDSTTSGLRERAAAVEAFNSGALDGDPFNTAKRKQISLAYGELVPNPSVLLQGDDAGAKARAVTAEVAKRTGVVPETVSNLVRGTLVDADPARVEQGLRVASQMTRGNPNAFATAGGREQIEQAAAEYDYHLGVGRSPQQAAAIIAERNDPAWKAKLPGIRSNEAAAEFLKGLKDDDTIGETRRRLATGILGFGRPDQAFDEQALTRINSDFQREALLEYQRTGRKDVAEKLALDRLVGDPTTGRRGVYATTNITGTPTIMKYSPEAAAGYPAVGGSKDYVGDQFVDAVKQTTGQTIRRSDIVVIPPSAVEERAMAEAFAAGRPVPYNLAYRDKNGVVQRVPGAVGFVADPGKARIGLGERVRAEQARKRDRDTAAEAVPVPGAIEANPGQTLGAD